MPTTMTPHTTLAPAFASIRLGLKPYRVPR
jgi:hypothetical protein